ncbi:MAG: hypothetical protein KL787_07875 [Taibaiella sp.]|nr:hypothetical protein [Taibaiella sp.]MBX9449618.1 hypothetical protein [Taibaiella sp.]
MKSEKGGDVQRDILTPEEVKEMLYREGREVTIEEAELILAFLRKMADIVVANYLNRDMDCIFD